MKVFMIFLILFSVFAGNFVFAQSQDYTVGKVQFPDRCYYSVGSGTVIIDDSDMNKDPEQVESVPIQLWSSRDTDIRTPNVIETGKDTGVFEATVFFNMYDEAFSQRIRVFEGDTLHVRYVDKTIPSDSEQAIEAFVVMGTLPPDQKWGDNWKTLSVEHNDTYVYDTCMAEFIDRQKPNDQTLNLLDIVYHSPLKQIENGLYANEVKCKDSLVLLQKYDGSPACVTESTKLKLVERGWTSKDSTVSVNECEKGVPPRDDLIFFDCKWVEVPYGWTYENKRWQEDPAILKLGPEPEPSCPEDNVCTCDGKYGFYNKTTNRCASSPYMPQYYQRNCEQYADLDYEGWLFDAKECDWNQLND